MQLQPLDVFEEISPAEFKKQYYLPQKPVVIRRFAQRWPALKKWNWDYFKEKVGEREVGVYNNVKSDAYTPINKADGYMKFGEYLDLIRQGPVELRIFLFNIFQHAPDLVNDFSWPEEYLKGFVKSYPMLFTGGAGSITHMHFDIDLSHILHTQFGGRKRVLMFPYQEQFKLYRKPFEVLSMVDFSRYYLPGQSKVDYDKFPALRKAVGFDHVLEPGDTLFMPAGYWHHMEYIEPGFAMSLRALQPSLSGKLQGVWNLIGMRNIDTLMKKTAPVWWYERKESKVRKNAEKVLHS